jgi:hypothetical protein
MTPNPVLAMAFRGEGCSNSWLPDWLPALREYFSLRLYAHSQETDAEVDAARVRCEQVQGTWDRRQHGRATLSLKMRRLLQRALRRLCYRSYQLQLLWQRLQYVWHKPYMHRFALSLRQWTADLRRGRVLWSWRNLQRGHRPFAALFSRSFHHWGAIWSSTNRR